MVTKLRLRKFFRFFFFFFFLFVCSPVSRSFTCIALVPKWTWSQLCDVLTSLFFFKFVFSFFFFFNFFIISKKNNYFNKFKNIGADIGLLFQISDDLIDRSGNTKKVGKKTKKDLKKGKATLIGLLGSKNTIKYGKKLKLKIFKNLSPFGIRAKDLKNTIEHILERSKWAKNINI